VLYGSGIEPKGREKGEQMTAGKGRLTAPMEEFMRVAANSVQERETQLAALVKQLETIEANLHPLNLAPLNEIVIRAMMEIKMRDVTGFIVICIPYFCIQSVMDDIMHLNQFVTEKAMEISREYQKILEDKIRLTKVPIHVELGQTEIKFQDLLLLKRGDIIQLQASVNEPLNFKIGGRDKFHVELVIFKSPMFVTLNS